MTAPAFTANEYKSDFGKMSASQCPLLDTRDEMRLDETNEMKA